MMNTWNQSKNVSNLDIEKDTVMGSFEKDFKDLGVTGKLSFCKASIFFFCKASTFVLAPLISWEKSLANLFLFGLKGCLWTGSQYQELVKNQNSRITNNIAVKDFSSVHMNKAEQLYMSPAAGWRIPSH